MDARSWFPPPPPHRRRRLPRSRRVAPGRIARDDRMLWDFGSNDYLGLSWHPALRRAAIEALECGPLGAGGSRWIGGDDPRLHALEARLAQWKGFEAALVVGSGFLLNLGLLEALGGRAAEVFADRLNHASLIDGARLQPGRVRRFRHRDLDQLEAMLARARARRRIVVSDGVFSMDGDTADLRRLIALAEAYDAIVVLDDAHGIGVLGPGGRGLSSAAGVAGHPRLVEVGTFGKAFGGYGAFVLGPRALIEGLVQRLRTAIYSTAPPPALSAAMLAALDLIEEGEVVRALAARIARMRAALDRLGRPATESAIQPWIVGGDDAALAASRALAEAGFFVPAIRPPTVPEGSARLRISLSAALPLTAIDALAEALGRLA